MWLTFVITFCVPDNVMNFSFILSGKHFIKRKTFSIEISSLYFLPSWIQWTFSAINHLMNISSVITNWVAELNRKCAHFQNPFIISWTVLIKIATAKIYYNDTEGNSLTTISQKLVALWYHRVALRFCAESLLSKYFSKRIFS